MMKSRMAVLWILLATVATACAGPRTSELSGQGAPATTAPNRPLVVLSRGEPIALAIRAFQTVGGGSYPHLVLNATFDDLDQSGTPFAVLPEALPQVNTDTWRVLPDGTMDTIYHLKPGIVWHDGTPLEAADFVFAWQVYANAASGSATVAPVGEMREVSAPDSRTVVIHWRRLYPGAAAVYSRTQSGFGALPRHVLERSYLEESFEAFSNHPYWTDEYIGLGPYRLEKWERGSEIDVVAFDQFVLGRPKIDRLRFLVANDANVAVASILSGDAHIALDYVMYYPEGSVLRQQWAGTDRGTVLFSPILFYFAQIQLRPDQVSTSALRDVRFRQALAHGLNKQELNEALLGGTAVVTDGLLSPRVSYYSAIEPTIAKYPYDPRRAQELLDEMGLQRGTDGFYLGLERQPFSLDILSLVNPTSDSQNAIIVETYRRIGLNAAGRILPAPLFGDGQTRASMGAMQLTGGSGFERAMNGLTSASISRPETRWQGSNRGAWSSPAYDRLYDQYNTTLDLATQIQLLAQMEKIASEEVPWIPLCYTPLITPYPASLTGPGQRTYGDTDTLARIWEWQWTS
jgi:peptide/nickel transport system substrate-binding protein